MNKFYLQTKSNGSEYQIYIQEIISEEKFLKKRYRKKKNENSFSIPNANLQNHLIKSSEESKRTNRKYLSSIKGWRLTLSESYIKEIVKKIQKDAKKTQQTTLLGEKIKILKKNDEIEIPEEDGVKLSLTFKSTARIRKMEKVDQILLNIRSMSYEEAYYWYSKVFTRSYSRKGVKAFRILMG